MPLDRAIRAAGSNGKWLGEGCTRTGLTRLEDDDQQESDDAEDVLSQSA